MLLDYPALQRKLTYFTTPASKLHYTVHPRAAQRAATWAERAHALGWRDFDAYPAIWSEDCAVVMYTGEGSELVSVEIICTVAEVEAVAVDFGVGPTDRDTEYHEFPTDECILDVLTKYAPNPCRQFS